MKTEVKKNAPQGFNVLPGQTVQQVPALPINPVSRMGKLRFAEAREDHFQV